MMHCPACAKDVNPTIGTVEGSSSFDPTIGRVSSPVGARFVHKCPECEQVLGPASRGGGTAVSVPPDYSHLPIEKRTFTQGHLPTIPAPPPDVRYPEVGDARPAPGAQAERYVSVAHANFTTAPLAGATGEQIVARMHERLAALDAIVPGLTAERAMLRRTLKAATRKAPQPPSNVVPIDRTAREPGAK
jgi:hypothetical protein